MRKAEQKPEIKTFIGTMKVEGVRKDSNGYWAVTGTGWDSRSWMISGKEYEAYKKVA